MVTDNSEQAPYAPVNHVLNLIRRLHDRGLPNPLNLRALESLGVPEGNAPRTLAAMRFLGLVDEDGNIGAAGDRLQRATSSEYPSVLAEVLRAAYAPVFAVADPAQDTEIAIHDAFRLYQPRAQRARMVNVFLSLCQEAGLVQGGPPQARSRIRRSTSGGDAVPRAARQTATTNPTPTGRPNTADAHPPAHPPQQALAAQEGADYRLLSTLIQQLPKDGHWSQGRRDKWVQAMTAAVDLLIEVKEEAG